MARRVEPGHALALRPNERAAPARSSLRLRTGAVRILLGACRRQGNPLLRYAGRDGGGSRHHDTRGPAGLVRAQERPQGRSGAAPAAAGVHRRAGSPLRLLLQRYDHQGRRTPGQQSQAKRSRYPQHHERSPLPLRDLSADHEGDPGRVADHFGRHPMNVPERNLPLSRRGLLTAGGALIVGFSLAGGSGMAAPAGHARGDVAGPPDPNAIDTWIAIHADNTATLYFGKCELGQGNTTGLLQIAGEELDLDMSQLSAVRLDTNVTPNQGATSSSSSIERGGPQVRAAAAEARLALLARASVRLGVQTGSLTVAKGVVSVDGDPSRSVSYGELLGDKPFAVKFTGTAPRKQASQYKLVGTRVPRIDIPDKAAGKYQHMQHVRVANMLHGRVVRPRGQRAYGSGAKVRSIDNNSIANIPGAQIVRRGDFVGVVAEREWDAVKAAQQLDITWEESPALPDRARLAEVLRAAKTTDTVVVNVGDAEKGFAQAAFVTSAAYFSPYQAHAPFGPNCALADVGAESALVLSSTQDIYASRPMLVTLLGLPVERVRVQYYEGSGTFGHSCYEDAPQAAAIMSQAMGRPVRVQFMRWDEQ